jgi:hypothetical protein
MGYNGTYPAEVEAAVDEVLDQGGALCRLQGGYRIIDPVQLEKKDFSVFIDRVHFDIHKIIFNQLKGADRIAVFLCTAGQAISDNSKELMKEGELLKGYVYDIFASLAVEGAMDVIQAGLREEMSRAGLKITNRYSPGYCGWETTEQKKLFSLLPEYFCGVKLTDSCLMLPTKSVSGIIGIGDSVKFDRYTCNMCDAKNCLYKNLQRGTKTKSN